MDILLVGTSLSYDARNHPKNPDQRLLPAGRRRVRRPRRRRAVRARVSAEGRYYYPVTEKITFVGRAIGGHIEGWGGQDVRLLDLFYKGGETIRGFDASASARATLLTSDALGGETFWSATAEVRFPFPFVPETSA